jgi:predicted metal-dependent peptidase
MRRGWRLEEFLRRRLARKTPDPDWALSPPPGWFEGLLSDTRFFHRYPQYAGVVARMDPFPTNAIDTMAVALRHPDDPRSRIRLLVNLDYCRKYPQYRSGFLLHEIQHVVLGHLTNRKFHAVRYPRLMEVAMEMSADELIADPMPPGGLGMKAFERFGVRPGQSTLERYRLLVGGFECGQLRVRDQWFEQMRDTHRPGQSGTGHGAGLGDLIDARSDAPSERNWNRRGLGNPLQEDELREMKEAIAKHLRNPRGGLDDPRGYVRQRFAKELPRTLIPTTSGGRLNWQRILLEVFPRRRQMQPSYLRPSRRFRSRVGEIPGRVRRCPKPEILVGIDTSGSMTGSSLDLIAKEIHSLAPFARLTIIECDAAVHRVYPMPGCLGPFVGGGDTDFSPVFDEARRWDHFEGVIYFTDGRGSMPAIPPPLETLWAVTHHDPFHPDWGTVIRVGALPASRDE